MLRKATEGKSGAVLKNGKKAFPIALATLLVTTPFLSIQKAYAVSGVDITADDSDAAGDDSNYTISFNNDSDLTDGDTITITFDEAFTIDSSIDETNVKVNGDTPEKVKYYSSDNSIKITLNHDYSADEGIDVIIKKAITNPDSADKYDIDVDTSRDKDSDYGTIKMTGSSSSDEFGVSIGDHAEDTETTYTLGDIDLGKDELSTGDWVIVVFPDSSMAPDDISSPDVKINGYSVSDVTISGAQVKLKVPSSADTDDTLTIKFLSGAGITNPSADKNYTITVKYNGKTYESETFDISSSSSGSSGSGSTSLTLSPNDSTAGARTSYTVKGNFGSKKLKSDSQIKLEFPSSVSIPSFLSTSDFTINNKTPKSVSGYGNVLYLTTPDSFSSTSDVKVEISTDAWISNPKTAGRYTIAATVDGKTVTSDSYTITDTSTSAPAPTPTPTPAPTTPANNSTATIALTNTTLQKATGVSINVKALALPVQKNVDFLEVVFPAGYKLPGAVLPSVVTVNGVAASYVGIRGQNLLVYPAQDLPAASAASIVINASANIINPAAKNTYSIGLYSSREKNLLFARSVGVGGAVIPTTTKPAPAAPTIQYNPALPGNAAVIKPNVPQFMLQGKLYALAPTTYMANNSTTMVSPQFFKEALSLTTTWNNTTVYIVNNTKAIKLTVGSNIASVGSTKVTLPAKVELKNGTPMIPVKTVAEQLGYKIGWDAKTSNAYVYK